jgi:hypothetical protein
MNEFKNEVEIVKKWSYKVNLHYKTEWYLYFGEYALAIDNLLERSDQSQTAHLTLPTLFLIRHSLELAFKMNLIELEKMSGIKAKIDYSGKTAHVLSNLHAEFEKQALLIFEKEDILESIRKDFKERNKELKAFRTIFDKLDNWSYAFRYPVITDGVTKSFDLSDEINLASIIPVYKSAQVFLKYTTDVLADQRNRNIKPSQEKK